MKKKIAIFGASVSHQSIKHDSKITVGWSEYIKLLYSNQSDLISYEFKKFTYPGNRFSDAGILLLDDLLKINPDIAILEILVEDETRGRKATIDEYCYLYNSLADINCKHITLLIVQNKPSEETLERARLLLNLCNQYKFPYLVVDCPDLIRRGLTFNGVHTNADSGSYLAYKLFEKIKTLSDYCSYKSLPKNAFISINKINLTKCKFTTLKLKLIFKNKFNVKFSLIQLQKIGMHSPVFDVTISSNKRLIKQKKCIWDRYCYYDRNSYVTLVDSVSYIELDEAYIDIDVSNEAPAYDSINKNVYLKQVEERFFWALGRLSIISNVSAELQLISIY